MERKSDFQSQWKGRRARVRAIISRSALFFSSVYIYSRDITDGDVRARVFFSGYNCFSGRLMEDALLFWWIFQTTHVIYNRPMDLLLLLGKFETCRYLYHKSLRKLKALVDELSKAQKSSRYAHAGEKLSSIFPCALARNYRTLICTATAISRWFYEGFWRLRVATPNHVNWIIFPSASASRISAHNGRRNAFARMASKIRSCRVRVYMRAPGLVIRCLVYARTNKIYQSPFSDRYNRELYEEIIENKKKRKIANSIVKLPSV